MITTAVSFVASVQAQEEAKPVYVLMQTTKGDIVLELNAERAPITVKNFVQYVEEGFFTDTVFHRVIKDFMIQGGGYSKDSMGTEKKTREPIRNEGGNGLKNEKYTIAMARTSDPDSATAQFFINTKNNGFLNRAESADGFGYAVFGKVVKGKEIVDAIAAGSVTSKGGERSFPIQPVVITATKIVDAAYAK